MLVFSIVVIFISGFFLSMLLIPEKYQNDYFWILMPFLGISFTILVLQTCAYLNIPISISAYPYLIIVIAGTLILYYKKNRPKIPELPYVLFALAIIVLAANGLGYFVVGTSDYIGYGWIDQYNYVGISQFLMDKPFNTSFDQVEYVPYLVDAILKKNDRIGQNVLQGYIAILSFVNAKTAYGPISLLSPLLTFFAIWALSRGLIKNTWAQYGAAISGSCIPGFALIHLQNFLSQALAVPFLLISPLFIYIALKEKDWRFITIGILIFAAIHSIYTEFSVLFIFLVICGGIWFILQTKDIVPSILIVVSIITAGLLINIGYLERSIAIMTRGDIPNILPSIFPFSESIQGLRYLWFGYSGRFLQYSWLTLSVNLSAVFLTLVGFSGILFIVKKQKNVVSILLFVLIICPLIFLSRSDPYPYQFYKMMMTISPIFMLGVWIVLSDFWEFGVNDVGMKEYIHPIVRVGPNMLLIALFISSIIMTGYIASFSINGGYRSGVNVVNTDEMIINYMNLENSKNRDYIVSVSHPYPLAWVAYHGRNNRIFFINNAIGDVELNTMFPKKFYFNDVSKFPHNATKFTVGQEYPQITPTEISEKLIASIDNPQGMEGFPGSEFNWLGKDMNLYLFWQGVHDQNITISILATAGPGDSDSKRIFTISMLEGKIQNPQVIEFERSKNISVPLVIQPGLNVVEFKSIYPVNASVIKPQDPREFLVHISQMKIIGNL